MESSASRQGTFRTRSRSRRRNLSSVSARLQPDFDPRDSLRNGVGQNRDSDEELDPKTMDFATLVEFLHPTFIFDHLQKILQFLRSDVSELCFPNIAPYKEMFLVKIANDNQRLKCPVFNEACRDLGRQILKVIDENRNVYRWVHMYDSYESGRAKDVLVYKKMFYNERKASTAANTASEFKIPGPLPAWPKALASQLQNLDLSTKKDPTPLLKDLDIPTSLKISVLNSTIQFLNDESRLSLEYPEMSTEQAKYFDSLIRQVDAQTHVGFGFRSLYAPLHKALADLGDKQILKTIMNQELNNTVRMTVRKVPKESPNDVRPALKSRPPEPPHPPPSRHLPDRNLPERYLPDRNLPDRHLPDHHLPDRHLPDRNLPERYLPDRNLPDRHLADHYTPDRHLADDYIPDRYLPDRHPPDRDRHLLERHLPDRHLPDRNLPERQLSKTKKEFLTRQNVVNACSPEFIESSLRRILDFVDDDKRAILEFDKINIEESSFLQMVFKLARQPEYHKLFTDECVILLKKIYRMERYETQHRKLWRVKMQVGRLHKFTRLGNLTFEKVPLGGKKQRNSTQTSMESIDRIHKSMESIDRIRDSRDSRSTTATDSSRSRDMSKERSIPDIAQRLMELSTRCDMTSGAQDHSIERLGLGSTNGAKPALKHLKDLHNRSISNDRSTSEQSESRSRRDRQRDRKNSKERRKTSKYGIAFKSAGEQLIDCTTVTDDTCHGQGEATPARQFGRKKKLMDDLSTPVEIDKAKRMMRQMGWDGGPLGARGEGITEPIMPAIHLAPGAGLGHIKVGSRSTAEFRACLLRALDTFVTGANRETVVSFTQPLTKREVRFLKPIVRALNQRRKIGVKLEEMDVLNKVLDELSSQPDVVLDYIVMEDNREIRFMKTDCEIAQTSGNKRKTRSSLTVPTPVPPEHLSLLSDSKNADIITTETLLNIDLTLKKCSRKAYRKIACRVTFLEKINEFLKAPDEKKEYICDFILNNKQREYIHQVVTMVNKRDMKFSFGTRDENDVYRNIKRNINHCFMTVIFSGQKFVLHKRFYQKRFTNSSLEIPPPVSKEDKNAIIYENNTVRHAADTSRDSQSDIDRRASKNTTTKKEKDEKTNAIDKNGEDTSCDLNDDSDFLTYSERDDVLILNADDTDLEDLETDSQSDKTDSKDSDEYKDWESDCDDIKDLEVSDESMLIDILENENNSCLVDFIHEDSDEVEMIADGKLSKDFNVSIPLRNSKERSHSKDLDSEDTREKTNNRLNEDKTITNKPQNDNEVKKDKEIKTGLDIEMNDDEISLTPPLSDSKSVARVSRSPKEVNNIVDIINLNDELPAKTTTYHKDLNINKEDCICTDIDVINLHKNGNERKVNGLTHNSEPRVNKEGHINAGIHKAEVVTERTTDKDTRNVLDMPESKEKILESENSEEFITPHASIESLNIIEDLYANLDPPIHDNDTLDSVKKTEHLQADVDTVEFSKESELIKENLSQNSETLEMSEEYLTAGESIEKLSEDEDLYIGCDLYEPSTTLKDIDETIEVEFSLQDSNIQGNTEHMKDEIISQPHSSLDQGIQHSNMLVINYKTVDGEKSPTYKFYDNLEGYISELSIKKDVKNINDAQITNETNNKDTSAVETDIELTANNSIESEVNNNGDDNNDTKLIVATENECIIDESDSKTRTATDKSPNVDQNGANTLKYSGDNLVLKRAISRDSLHIESSPSSSKRSRSDSENSDKISKRYKHETPKRVNIQANSEELNIETVKAIQTSISYAIDESVILPLLECNGIQNGRLLYTCYNDQTLIWLKKVLKTSDLHLTVIDAEFVEEKNFKLQVKLNSFIGEESEKILNRIELFNTGLNTNVWEVIERKVTDSHTVLIVKVDEDSYQYIVENNFSLFAGITKAHFSTIWD